VDLALEVDLDQPWQKVVAIMGRAEARGWRRVYLAAQGSEHPTSSRALPR